MEYILNMKKILHKENEAMKDIIIFGLIAGYWLIV